MKVLGGALGVLAVGILAATFAFWPAPPADSPLSIGGDFRLMHESGEVWDTAQAFANRPMLVYFGYTYCPDVCPTTLLDMVVASEATAVDEALVFVSVDPARDNAADLAAYTDLFDAHLHGFTGTPAALEAVKTDWAIFSARHDSPEFTDYLLDHTTLTFLTDAQHRVVEVFRDSATAATIADTINTRF